MKLMNLINKSVENLFLYFNTIRFLKKKQIFYRIYYKFNFFNINKNLEIPKVNKIKSIFDVGIPKKDSTEDFKTFNFLNKTFSFNSHVEWNISAISKLWLYNLHYFDFINYLFGYFHQLPQPA